MAKHPKDPTEAVDALGIRAGSTVLVLGPDHGYAEAFAEAAGDDGKVIVQAPPPELDVPKTVEVVEDIPADTKAETVIAWTTVVPVHAARALSDHVGEDGSFWLVIPKVDRDARAPVTEGDVKRAMLSGGWREHRVQPLSTDAYALGFRRRR
jgi:hypothetical protein